jgi:translation initiation factor 3 subunit L
MCEPIENLCCSYLKLYTTLPVSKLATFMAQQARQEAGTDVMNKFDLGKEIEELTIHLLCFKHKMKNLVWSKGASGLEGHFQSGSEVRLSSL